MFYQDVIGVCKGYSTRNEGLMWGGAGSSGPRLTGRDLRFSGGTDV